MKPTLASQPSKFCSFKNTIKSVSATGAMPPAVPKKIRTIPHEWCPFPLHCAEVWKLPDQDDQGNMKQCWGPLATGLSQTSGYISPIPWLSVATAVQSNSAPKVVAIPRVGPESQTVVFYLICISQGTGVLSLIAVMVFGGPSIPSSLSRVRCVRLETYRP